jgi:lysophospholipase L1-like esterase
MNGFFKRVKGSFYNFFILLISCLLSILVVEIYIRLNPNLFGIRTGSFQYHRPDPIGKRGSNLFRASALLGYEHVPNSTSSVNLYGLIGKEYKLRKDKGVYRILLLGDSIAAQNGIREELEDRLNSKPSLDAKYAFEIWNAGVSSYDIRRYALYLKYKGIQYNPDMLLIFFYLNDFAPNTFIYYHDKKGIVRFDYPFRELSNKYILNQFLINHSYLYRFLIVRLEKYLVINKKKPQNKAPDEENGRFYLNMIRGICQKNKIKLFCVLFSDLKPLQELKHNQKEQYEIISKVLMESGVQYIDLRSYLPEDKLYSLRDKTEDSIHPSLEGEKLIAEIIYNYMLKSLSFLKQ